MRSKVIDCVLQEEMDVIRVVTVSTNVGYTLEYQIRVKITHRVSFRSKPACYGSNRLRPDYLTAPSGALLRISSRLCFFHFLARRSSCCAHGAAGPVMLREAVKRGPPGVSVTKPARKPLCSLHLRTSS